MINACQYWEGYTGARPPKCNNGQPCIQCRMKYVTQRGWKLHNGMLHKENVEGPLSLIEAFEYETRRDRGPK